MVILTLWHDKIFDRQGRQIVLSCNCSLGIPSEVQVCPVCNPVTNTELLHAFNRENWMSILKQFSIKMHAMRRRLALLIVIYNLRSPAALKIKIKHANCFMGWTDKSKMLDIYTEDIDKHLNLDFKDRTGKGA